MNNLSKKKKRHQTRMNYNCLKLTKEPIFNLDLNLKSLLLVTRWFQRKSGWPEVLRKGNMEKRDAKLQNKKTKKISGRGGQTAVTILHVKHGGAPWFGAVFQLEVLSKLVQ